MNDERRIAYFSMEIGLRAIPKGAISENELLRLTASADQPSQHPLAEAIVAGARTRGIQLVTPQGFNSIPSQGIEAQVDGRCVHIGNARLIARENVEVGDLAAKVSELAKDAKTAMYVAVDGRAGGVVAVADVIRESARRAIRLLHDGGVQTVMLTSDSGVYPRLS